MKKNTLSYCGELLRRNDADRFLISLFAPASIREDIWALMAFNWEIAKTRSVVSESTLGLIRLQWWRDEIGKIYAGQTPSAHEVPVPLAAAIIRHNLPRDEFDALIYAREFDLEDVLPGNLEGLMNYADFTTAPLLSLAMRMIGDDPDLLPLQPVAINAGLASVIQNAPYHARTGRCYWPEDLMRRHDVTREDFANARKPEAFAEIVRAICAAQVKGIHQKNRFLSAVDVLADIYFQRVKSLNYNVFHKKMQMNPPFKELRLVMRTLF